MRLHSACDPYKWQLSSRENEQDNVDGTRPTQRRYKAASFKHKLLSLCYPFLLCDGARAFFFRVTTALESPLFSIPDAVSLPRCRWKNQRSFPVSTRNENLIGPLFFGFVTSHLYSYITTKHETRMQSLIIVLTSATPR